MAKRSTSRWSTAAEKWEFTWTSVPLGEDGRPDSMLAGIPMSSTPEGKPSSTWKPFSVSVAANTTLVWWRRPVVEIEELG